MFNAAIPDAEAVELCSHLFGTVLPIYSDLADQKAVERVIEAALAKETFLRAFASSLVRTDGAHLSRQECFVLHRWSSLALQALRLPAGLKAAQKLMERQVILMHMIKSSYRPGIGVRAAPAAYPMQVMLAVSVRVILMHKTYGFHFRPDSRVHLTPAVLACTF